MKLVFHKKKVIIMHIALPILVGMIVFSIWVMAHFNGNSVSIPGFETKSPIEGIGPNNLGAMVSYWKRDALTIASWWFAAAAACSVGLYLFRQKRRT